MDSVDLIDLFTKVSGLEDNLENRSKIENILDKNVSESLLTISKIIANSEHNSAVRAEALFTIIRLTNYLSPVVEKKNETCEQFYFDDHRKECK